VQSSGGVEPAGEGDAYLLADGQGFENYGHACGTSQSFWLRDDDGGVEFFGIFWYEFSVTMFPQTMFSRH
jgi:hypothetical protein